MPGHADPFPPDLAGLAPADWLRALRGIGRDHGFFEPLGRSHLATFVDRGDTLLVSFETVPGVQSLSDTRTPLAFDMVGSHGWSGLSMLSMTDTWFRDDKVFAFFDQLTDDRFFEDFETVIFHGAGPAGHAAAAFSVAAPGARVLVLQPQATLAPRIAGWDDRFTEHRRRDFTSRYGFAPALLEGAAAAHVFYDPHERLDAMHAALFERPGVTRHRLPFFGDALQADLRVLDLLPAFLAALADDRLDAGLVARLMRMRRDHPPYLRRLLARLDADGRAGLARMLCTNVTARMHAPRFARRLAQLDGRAENG